MKVLFGGTVHMDYGQIYVRSGDGDMPADPLPASFAGQRNGLCGVAIPGFLFLVSGTHTGRVPFTVELHDAPPPLEETWEDVVEATYRPSEEAMLLEWQGNGWPLDLEERDYRVRYSALGMDEAGAFHVRPESKFELDRYLLQFWPAPAAPDLVVKQTSAKAAYWHGCARQEPPPPPPPRPADWRRQLDIDHHWGGVAPAERLLALGFKAVELAKLDRPVVEALERADPQTQRRIARWAARRAFDAAGLSNLDWVAPALDALDRGDELPPPFDDRNEVSRRLFPGGATARIVTDKEALLPLLAPEAAAIPTLWDAADPDPLQGAVYAVYGAALAVGGGYRDLLTELRVALLVPPR